MTASDCLSKDTAAKLSAVSKRIPIEQIGELAPDDYVGLIDDQAVEHLKLRLAAEGQHMPIWVRQNGNAAKMPYSVVYETKEGSWFASDKDKASARAARQRIEAQYGPLTTSGEDEKAASDKARGEWRGKFWRRSFGGPNIPIGQGFNRLPSGGLRGVKSEPAQVGGKISLEVRQAPGLSVRLTEMKSSNPKVPMLVQLGRSMGGPA